MELWIGAEFSGDIHADIRGARNFLEDEINNEIKGQDYDLELESWNCIAIIMEDDDYDEIVKYSKKIKIWISGLKSITKNLSIHLH